VARVVDVAVHHRARRRDPDAVRGGDDLDPLGGGQLALGEHPAHVVVEDLGRGAGDGVEPASFASVRNSSTESPVRDPVDDLHRAEGVQVHPGHRASPRGEVEVRGAGQLGVDAALHADLGRADVPRLRPLARPRRGQRERVGVGARWANAQNRQPV
jgi:hypothetical protein